jgi:hypothetical protein
MRAANMGRISTSKQPHEPGAVPRRSCSLFPVPCSLAALLLLAGAAAAESPPRVEGARVGLLGVPGKPTSGRSRNGSWTPVFLQLKGDGPKGNTYGAYTISVESTDDESEAYHYDVPAPALDAGESGVAVAYVRPGAINSTFAVKVKDAAGNVLLETQATRDTDKGFSDRRDVLFLAVGSKLPDMTQAFAPDPAAANAAPGSAPDRGALATCYAEKADDLPDRWFGYEAVDVVVLDTRDTPFLNDLKLKSHEPQLRALVEWVRRGGRLVISVGAKTEETADLLKRMQEADGGGPVIDCAIGAPTKLPQLRNVLQWVQAQAGPAAAQEVNVAVLTPGEQATVLVAEQSEGAKGSLPVIVQGACGLGRVWLMGFEVRPSPFKDVKDADPKNAEKGSPVQKAFWLKVQKELAPQATAPAPTPAGRPFGPGPAPAPAPSADPQVPEIAAELQRALENFESVQPVPFYWVALFILIYIVVIGPLDYLILKRLFKRLELTWITFPAVVLAVSVLAYFAAYALKGDDLRINKLDIVDYDLSGPAPAAYGSTWFTLFSPRIQNYTVGLEPAAPDWAKGSRDERSLKAVNLAVLENPDASDHFTSPSLFRQPYAYAEDAVGLERVPIPVWSTRTFQASWRATLDPAKPPVEADFRRVPSPAERGVLAGTLTNRLPVKLEGVVLFYRGHWVQLPNDLAPGEQVKFEKAADEDTRLFAGIRREAKGFYNGTQLAMVPPALTAPQATQELQEKAKQITARYQLVKDLLFHAKATGNGSTMNNSGLRTRDQSWRLDNPQQVGVRDEEHGFREEVILVARTPAVVGRAEAAAQDPGSATRLWLDRLPGSQPDRPALSGYLSQWTFVRIYIPVKPAQTAKPEKP